MPSSHGAPKGQDSSGSPANGPSQANIAGAADGTYSANEQTALNDLVTAVNAILAALRTNGTIAS